MLWWTYLLAVAVQPVFAAEGRWEHARCRIRVAIAVEAVGERQERLEQRLPEYVQQRIEATIGPRWATEVALAQGAERTQLLDSLGSGVLPERLASLAEGLETRFDKHLFISVRDTPAGVYLAGQEYDTYLQHWGAVVYDHVHQRAALPERVFQLLRCTYSPLARLELDPENEDRVVLLLQGAEIATKDAGVSWIAEDDIFLPYLRRTTRDGELVENGLQIVPWTYLVADDIESGAITAHVYSGTRRPLGVRRRGLVEQLAIALRVEPAPTDVHLRSRTDASKPLAGYQVFVQDTGDKALELVGTTDYRGNVLVPTGTTPVRLLYLKHGGELLARVPLVPGLARRVEMPLPDDDARLLAEASLASVRENLVDVVAQRNIIMARARRLIEQGNLELAEKLVNELDRLPGRTHFDRQLEQLSTQHVAEDPQVQRRIDRMLSDTRGILAHFLDVRETNRLRDELNVAKSSGG